MTWIEIDEEWARKINNFSLADRIAHAIECAINVTPQASAESARLYNEICGAFFKMGR